MLYNYERPPFSSSLKIQPIIDEQNRVIARVQRFHLRKGIFCSISSGIHFSSIFVRTLINTR